MNLWAVQRRDAPAKFRRGDAHTALQYSAISMLNMGFKISPRILPEFWISSTGESSTEVLVFRIDLPSGRRVPRGRQFRRRDKVSRKQMSLCSVGKGLGVHGASKGQDSVQVVQFMLEEFAEVSFEFHGVFAPVEIAEAEGTSEVAANAHQDVGEAHTVVPKVKGLDT